jgi:hypothetical protein
MDFLVVGVIPISVTAAMIMLFLGPALKSIGDGQNYGIEVMYVCMNVCICIFALYIHVCIYVCTVCMYV